MQRAGERDLIVSNAIGTNEPLVLCVAEHVVDVPLVHAGQAHARVVLIFRRMFKGRRL